MLTIAYIDDDNCTVSGDEVWQYDYGQQMTITGLPSLPSGEVTQVHFGTNKISGTAYAVEAEVQGSAVVVDIPDLILTSGVGEVWCFVFVCDADDGETVYRVHFPVIRRPKPNIYNEDKAYEHMFARTIAKVTAAATEASEAVEAAQEVLDSIPSDYTELSRRVLALYPTETASGSVVAFDDGADDIPVKSLSVAIEPVQSGTGDPSPTNVRPISGWDAVEVVRCGKNLFDKDAVSTGKRLSTTTGLEEDDNSYCVTDYIPVASGKTVFIQSSGTSRRWFYDKNKNPVTYLNSGNNQAFTPSADGYIRVTIATSGSYAQDLNTYQIEVGSTATAYEPYTAETYPISLTSAGTVYGGTLDVTTGVLTVTHGFIASYAGQSLPGAWISDRDVYAAGTTPTTGAQVCYELATPTTYHLTPTEITTLLGNNTVWSDAGDITLTYRADLQKYFEA